MTINARTLRWKHLWWFLSLDITGRFEQDLWIPIDHIQQFQSKLRAKLTALDASTVGDPGIAVNAIMRWFFDESTATQRRLMVLWNYRLYYRGGADRVDESVWQLVPQITKRPELYGCPQDLVVILDLLRNELAQAETALELRLELEHKVPLTDWDRFALSQDSSAQEDVLTLIKLMSECNIFLAAWEKHCNQLTEAQLQMLYRIAQQYAARKHMLESTGLAYPGSWRFELEPLLSIFATKDRSD